MGKQVNYFAGPEDDQSLRSFIFSENLYLVPFNADLDILFIDRPEQYPGWYVSPKPLTELHVYGNCPRRVSDATDPLVELSRSYYEPPYLVAGRLYWSGGVKEYVMVTKAVYSKVSSWISNNWSKRVEDGFYIGPDAQRLVKEEGAQLCYLPPGMMIDRIILP